MGTDKEQGGSLAGSAKGALRSACRAGLYHGLYPARYRRGAGKAVHPKKIVFLEVRMPQLTDSGVSRVNTAVPE